MAAIPRPSLIHLRQEKPAIPLPDRVTIGLAAFSETVREGLLAFCVGVGLSVVAEIFEEEITQLVGPRGRHNPERQAYRHGQEDRQLTLGGRRVGVQKPRARTKAGAEVELESFRFFASRDLLTQAALDRMLARLSTRRYGGVTGTGRSGAEVDDPLLDLTPVRGGYDQEAPRTDGPRSQRAGAAGDLH
jgi:hypothetical protein